MNCLSLFSTILVWPIHKLKSLVINALNIIYKDQNVAHSGENRKKGRGRVKEVLWTVKNQIYKQFIIQLLLLNIKLIHGNVLKLFSNF